MRGVLRQGGWIAAAVALYLAAVVIAAWPAMLEWRRTHLTLLTLADGPAAVLDGIGIDVTAVTAMILPERPDRALIHLRLTLAGDPARRAAWLACDLALTDGEGRRWLPLMNALGAEVVRLMADDGGTGLAFPRSCSQSLAAEAEASVSDQAFLVPADVVDALRVEISGLTLRPQGVSIPLKIVRQTLR